MKKIKSVQEMIQDFLEYLPQLTKDESDFILEICNWTDDTKLAFKLAKGLFEEKLK